MKPNPKFELPADDPGHVLTGFAVWHAAMGLVDDIHRASATFPENEVNGLTNLVRQSAYAVPRLLAESSGTHGEAEFKDRIERAAESLRDLEAHLAIAAQVGYLDHAQVVDLDAKIADVEALLTALLGWSDETKHAA